MFLFYVYINILCYSSIIYICSMHVVYFLHNFISISSFPSFPHYIIYNPVCCGIKCFIFFFLVSGLVCIIVLFLLACYPSLLWSTIVYIMIIPLFRIKQIGLGTVLISFFRGSIWILQINWRSYHGLIQHFRINWRNCRGSIQIYLWWFPMMRA